MKTDCLVVCLTLIPIVGENALRQIEVVAYAVVMAHITFIVIVELVFVVIHLIEYFKKK